jgi:lipopolysaccharide biosynthesis regulator YciM
MPAESTLLLATLFVIAAAAGWAFARYSDATQRQSDAAQLSADYYRGLNYLLNQKPDEALEVFMRMMELDDDAIETHLLLGSLFRRRGEVERAIRIHQNIISRPTLSPLQKHQAQFALGEDYLRAGLFDRAEELFEQLTESETHSIDALEGLVNIYEQEHEWLRAIQVRQSLEKLLTPDGTDVVAHYYCELAQEALQRREFDEARQYLKKARSGRHRTARGAMMRGDIARESGDCSLALKLYEKTVQQDPELLSEILPRARKCFDPDLAGANKQFGSLLRDWLDRNVDIRKELAYASIVNGLTDVAAIDEAVLQYLGKSEALSALFSAAVGEGQVEDPSVIRRIHLALHKLALKGARYRCRDCGFSGATLYWQCPSCKSWDTIRPIGHLNLEALLETRQAPR